MVQHFGKESCNVGASAEPKEVYILKALAMPEMRYESGLLSPVE